MFKRLVSSNVALNFFSLSGTTVIINLIGLVTLGYTARVLGPENYGLLVFGTSVAAYAGLALSPGLLQWGARAIAQNKSKAGEYLIIINSTQIILACLGYLALAIYSLFFLSGDEKGIVILFGLNLFLTAINIDFVYSGLELMRVTGLLGVLSATLNTIGLLTLVHSPAHTFRVPILTFSISFFIQLILYILIIKKYHIKFVFPPVSMFGKVLVASFPLGITSWITVLYSYANNFFVKAYLGTAALGVFYSAKRLVEIVAMGYGIIGTVFIPRLSREVSKNREMARVYALIYVRILMTLAFLIAPIMFLEAHDLVSIIYGVKYMDAVLPLRIMSLVIICAAASTGYVGVLITFSQDSAILKLSIISGTAVLIGGFVLVQPFGLVGASVVWIIINLVGFVASLPVFRREIGSYGFTSWALPIIGGGAILICSYIFQRVGLSILLRGPLEVLVYLPFAIGNILPVIKRLRES